MCKKEVRVQVSPDVLKQVEEAAKLIRDFAQKQQDAFNFNEPGFGQWQHVSVSMLELENTVKKE